MRPRQHPHAVRNSCYLVEGLTVADPPSFYVHPQQFFVQFFLMNTGNIIERTEQIKGLLKMAFRKSVMEWKVRFQELIFLEASVEHKFHIVTRGK